MQSMHEDTPETEALTEAVVGDTRRRIADPQPLDHPVPPDELNEAAGSTITPDGIGGKEALRIWADVLAPATIPTDHPSFLAFVPGAPSKASVLFDLAVSASEVYGGSWLEGGGAVWAENQVLGWLADLAGMPVGSGGHPREPGEPTEHLVLRPHGAAALEPAPPVDLGRAHREVEQNAGLGGGARHRVVERLWIRDPPACVVHDGLGERVRFRGVLVHRLHRRSDLARASRRARVRAGLGHQLGAEPGERV